MWMKWRRSERIRAVRGNKHIGLRVESAGDREPERGQDLAEGPPPNGNWWALFVYFAILERLTAGFPDQFCSYNRDRV